MAKDYDIPGLGNYDDIAGMDFGSVIREFTGGPGKKLDTQGIINFLFRGKIPDIGKANDIALFISQCEDCHDWRHLKLALMTIANWAAIEGHRTHVVLQATIGELDTNNGKKRGRPFWQKQDHDQAPVNGDNNDRR